MNHRIVLAALLLWPTDETFNRKFHHLTAKVKRSGMTVRTRFGFFGGKPDADCGAGDSRKPAVSDQL